jgi:hypothetical protein
MHLIFGVGLFIMDQFNHMNIINVIGILCKLSLFE